MSSQLKLVSYHSQTEYVCWEMVPRHHNIVRYRVSWALIYQDFQVCDYANFRSGREWKYDTLIGEFKDWWLVSFSFGRMCMVISFIQVSEDVDGAVLVS